MVIIQTVNLSKVYSIKSSDETIYGIKNVSIKINKGEYIAIIGKSGSGKSTLMHILGLLDTPSFGELYIEGVKTNLMNEKQLALIRNEKIGFVFQSFNLLPRTSVLDNVILPLKYSKIPKSLWTQKAMKMLDLVQLSNRLNNKSNELSGGQKQRVAIARALINDPSVIFADEPTGSLDSKTSIEIIDLFKKLNLEGKTIILVTHDKDIASHANRQITLKDGEIINDNT